MLFIFALIKRTQMCVFLTLSMLWAASSSANIEQLAQGSIIAGTVTIGGSRYDVDWYMPTATASGLVYLQHGFSRKSRNLRDLATVLMDKGLMVLSLNASMAGGNENLALSVADALMDNPPAPPDGGVLPSPLVLSGHSAGALNVSMIAKRMIERNYTMLAGLVLLDPVDARGKFAPVIDTLNMTTIPTLSITASASSCNASNNTEGDLRRLNDNFVGIKLIDQSKHTDAEGNNADFLARLICGTPRDYNIITLQNFVSAWASDMATGMYTETFYPGGDAV